MKTCCEPTAGSFCLYSLKTWSLNAPKSSLSLLSSFSNLEYIQSSPQLWWLSDRIILQGPVIQLLLDYLVIRTRPSPIRPSLLSSPLIGNCLHPYSSSRMVEWLKLILTSSRVAFKLCPASRTTHYSPWLPSVAFINSDRGDSSYTTTTKSWIGVDLEVRPPVSFINSDQGKPPLPPPVLRSGSKNSEHLLKVHDRIKTRASIIKETKT